MIVTCENCHKRYLVKDEDIGIQGRQVRCVACDHHWFQTPSELVKDLNEEFPPEEIPFEKVAGKGKRKARSSLLISLSLIVCTVAIAYFGRQEIVRLLPESADLYKSIGLSVATHNPYLKLSNIQPVQAQEGRDAAITIRGDVVNTSKEVQALHPLNIELLGPCPSEEGAEKECVLKKWQHNFSESRLLPGEKISFETEPTGTFDSATNVRVQF